MKSRTAAKVSTCESGATPSSFLYPQNCPRTTSAGTIGRTAFSNRVFSSRIASERLFDHDTRVLGTAGLRQTLDNVGEHTGWDRKIVQRPARFAQRLAQSGVRAPVAIVAFHVTKQRREFGERGFIHAASLVQAFSCARPETLEAPAGPGDADDRYLQIMARDQRLQRRKDL